MYHQILLSREIVQNRVDLNLNDRYLKMIIKDMGELIVNLCELNG